MKIIAFDGSPRKNGNSTIIMKRFLERAEAHDASVRLYKTDKLDLKPCRGCLLCNTLKRCAMKNDDWTMLSAEILDSDAVAFSTPIYFHHASSSMKRLLDRFRSFMMVRITEDGLIHTPHQSWDKRLFLFTAHGSSAVDDAVPLVQLFEFINNTLGSKNELKYISAVRLALAGQIAFTADNLSQAYRKLGLPAELAADDQKRNAGWLMRAESLADELFS